MVVTSVLQTSAGRMIFTKIKKSNAMKDKIFCSAVIVAAGSGKRMGADRPKQFLELCGKTLLSSEQPLFLAAVRLLTK